MFCREKTRHRFGRSLTLAIPTLYFTLLAPAYAQPQLELVGRQGSVVERVLAGVADRAEAKLDRPSCRLLFSDFRNLSGRQLQETLDTVGQSAQTYLRGLVFYDGYGRSRCQTREVLAFTHPGSRAVFVCSSQFLEKARREPGLAAVILIHEELHALGLGENPPSSREITQKVIERCGK
jgi:hypothetical protein